jgi:predicted secreted protein
MRNRFPIWALLCVVCLMSACTQAVPEPSAAAPAGGGERTSTPQSVPPTAADVRRTATPQAVAPAAEPINLLGYANGATVNVSVGRTLVYSVQQNATTGFVWTFTYDQALLTTVSDTVELSSNAIGAGGTRTLTLQAVAAGTSTFTAVYAQAGSTTPRSTTTLTLVIAP